MSWAGVLVLAVSTTAAAWWYDGLGGLIAAGGWWLLLLGGRFVLEWSDRYGWVGRLRRRR